MMMGVFVLLLLEAVQVHGFVAVLENRRRPSGLQRLFSTTATSPSVEPIPESSSVKLTIPVSEALTTSAFKKAAADLAATRTIPGWRQKDAAKIPAGVVASAVGPDVIKAKAIEALSETEVHGAISSLGIEAVGQARLVKSPDELVEAYSPGKPFELVVSVDVWPKAEVDSYDGLEVTVEKVAAEEDVRVKAMEALRERYIDLNESDEPAEAGDLLVVDMDGFLRDEETGEKAGPLPVEGTIGGQDLEIVIDSGKFLPGLTDALVGVKAGETKQIPIDFPDQSRFNDKQPLAGAKALFEVKVKAVKTRSLPELNDAFADKIRPGLTLAELEKEVEYTVGSQEDDKTKEKVHRALEEALVEKLTVPLPETVVVESARQKFAVMLADMRGQGTDDASIKKMISPEGFEKYLKVIRPTVEKELRARLIVEAIARQEKIEADPAEIEDQLELVKRQYFQQEEKEGGNAQFNEDRAKEKIISELLRIKVLDLVAGTAHVTYTDPPPQPTEEEQAAVLQS